MYCKTKSKKAIMLVDDEPDICTIVKKFVNGNGYRISTFTSPTLALEHFRQDPEKYEVLVTDIKMPEMSGFELARNVKAINPKTKVVAMTTFEITSSEFQKVMPHSIIEAFMKKPVSMQQVKEVLEGLSTHVNK